MAWSQSVPAHVGEVNRGERRPGRPRGRTARRLIGPPLPGWSRTAQTVHLAGMQFDTREVPFYNTVATTGQGMTVAQPEGRPAPRSGPVVGDGQAGLFGTGLFGTGLFGYVSESRPKAGG